MRNKDAIICGAIYVLTFAFMLHYNLKNPLVNDRVYEYREYLLNVEVGWQFRNNLLNSCLIATWIPSLIQKWTGWDTMFAFKVFPPFFYALMPVFIYLIARRYLDKKYAVTSAVVVIFSSCILFFPDMGKTGIALGFMAGMVWAMLERRMIWAGVFAVLVVFSHYSTTVIAIGITGAVLAFVLLRSRFRLRQCFTTVKPYIITLSILVVITGIWHFGIARYSGGTMFSTMLQPEKAREIMGEGWGEMDVLDMGDRDFVAQKAFGLTLGEEPIPGKIEIIANWLVVVFITLGLYIVLRKKTVDAPFKIMLVALYGLILATIAIPQISIYYGTLRVYFTSLTVLAVCFPFGVKWLAEKVHIPYLLIVVIVLGLYAVSTSGLIYLPFGLVKVLPVAVGFP